MPALRQAAGSVHDDCCKLGQLTKQVDCCQRSVAVTALDPETELRPPTIFGPPQRLNPDGRLRISGAG